MFRRKAVVMNRPQVIAAIANALDVDGSGTHDLFDMFLDRRLADPHLESLRQEILAIGLSEGQPIPGKDFGPKAEEWLRQTYEMLRTTEPAS
jgi:hypothetical protein